MIERLESPTRADPVSVARIRVLRAYFQRGLIDWLRDRNREQALAGMRAVFAELEALAPAGLLARLWWVGTALLEVLAAAGSTEVVVGQRLLAAIDAEMRYLQERGDSTGSEAVPDLLREVVGYVCASDSAGERVVAVRHAAALAGWLTPTVEVEPASAPSMEPFDSAAHSADSMRGILAHLNEALETLAGPAAHPAIEPVQDSPTEPPLQHPAEPGAAEPLPGALPDNAYAETRARAVASSVLEIVTGCAHQLAPDRGALAASVGSARERLGELDRTIAGLRDRLLRLDAGSSTPREGDWREPSAGGGEERADAAGSTRHEGWNDRRGSWRQMLQETDDLARIRAALEQTTRQTEALLEEQARLQARAHQMVAQKSGSDATANARVEEAVRVLVAGVGPGRYAVPLSAIVAVTHLPAGGPGGLAAEAPFVHQHGGVAYPAIDLAAVLEEGALPSRPGPSSAALLLLEASGERAAILVERVDGHRSAACEPLGAQLRSHALFSGATLDGAGRIILMLDVGTLVQRVRTRWEQALTPTPAALHG